MSYSKAWSLIGTAEKRLGFPLIERKVGGHSGGGSYLTQKATDLMNRYEGFRKDVDTAIRKIYQRHFGRIKGRISI
jgi:molybdate transport system regulatory protein